MNEEYRIGRVTYSLTADFNERVRYSDNEAPSSTWVNIGYFFLQYIIKDLKLNEFFRQKTSDRKATFDCYTVSRFLTYARILDHASKLTTCSRLGSYFEVNPFC